jgi:hypothetical protein
VNELTRPTVVRTGICAGRVFGEDACRAKVGHSPQNLAALRSASLSLLRFQGVKEILSTLRHFRLRPLDLTKFLGILKNGAALKTPGR